MINRYIREEEGQTLVEYGLLISLIALIVIAVLTVLGQRLRTGFSVAASEVVTAT